MAEYIDREKLADGLKEWQNRLIETYGENDEYVRCLNSVLFSVDNAPAADVRPVVICKECKYYKNENKGKPWKSNRRYCVRSAAVATNPDDFCSRGEKREES